MSTWREEYQGDAESERLLFDRLALDMMQVQLKTRKQQQGRRHQARVSQQGASLPRSTAC